MIEGQSREAKQFRYRYKEYDTEDGPWEPITGATSALMGTISSMMMGVADMPVNIFKSTSHKSSETSARSSNDKAPSTGQNTSSSVSNSNENYQDNPVDTGATRIKSQGEPSKSTDSLASPEMSNKEPQSHSQDTSQVKRGVSLVDAIGAGKGVARVVDAGIKSPMDFTLSLAKGFHNAPRLYGDPSVRPHERITGFQSGIKAAGKVIKHFPIIVYLSDC